MSEGYGTCVVLTLHPNDLPDKVKGGQHVTLVYISDDPIRQDLYSDLLDAVSTAIEEYQGSGKLAIDKMEWFGEDGDAAVVTLDKTVDSEAVILREAVLDNLNAELLEIYEDSETYPVYRPHVTMGYKSKGFKEESIPEELPKELYIESISVWNGDSQSSFTLHDTVDDVLEHYGTPRHSGRYPWGSGKNPYQSSRNFMGYFEELKAQGMTEGEIAQALGMNSTQLRQRKVLAKARIKSQEISDARALRDKNWTNVAIAKEFGKNESYIRTLLAPDAEKKANRIENTANMLKEELDKGNYIDFGKGSEFHLPGVTRNTLDNAVAWLEDEGYRVHHIRNPLIGTRGKDTLLKVVTPGDVEWSDLMKNQDKITVPGASTKDGGETWTGPRPPKNLDSKRIAVRYGPDGGADRDGTIEIRPGAKDLDLGKSNYAQVRIAVDGTHYLKGMAHYSDNMPDGVDVIFNTNKESTGNPFDAMKKMSDDPMNPWGAVVKEGGQRGALNILTEEGDWVNWSKSMSSQMLSKQTPGLAKRQLDLTYDLKKAEYDEIDSLTNPTIKKHLLEKFADSADSSAVYLKAKGLPRTQNHVLLPVPNLKPTEIYAPQYDDGDRVVLIRHPHGGIFEIPELIVNNRSRTAKKIMGNNAPDAVGIHPQVAEQLSGADFDGDHVLVIPNPRGPKGIRTSPPLKELEGFDTRINYGPDEVKMENGQEVYYRQGVPFKTMTKRGTQTQMGEISNLITDMSIQDASQSELARAVKHSMVVIDAEKHNLDYRQSYVDNRILSLKKKYQPKPGGRPGGASTLISKARSTVRVPEIAPRKASEGGPIDKTTGKKVYVPTGKVNRWTDKKTGEVTETPAISKVPAMSLVDDAHQLSSGTPIEAIYADHANKLKELGNSARKAADQTPPLKYNSDAFKAYAPQVQSLTAKLNEAKSNAPLERKAQTLANQAVRQKKLANPDMDKDEVAKEQRKAIALYRARTGADKKLIKITPEEWNAIQAGAISNNRLQDILANTDLDHVKELATPRTIKGMPPGQISRARAMKNAGYTNAEIAKALGVSTSTLYKALN